MRRALGQITGFRIDLVPFFGGRLRSFGRDERGVSAVEFALLLPVMMTLYLGTVEVSQGISADRKVTLTARTVADLVAQVSSINNAGMTNVLNASAAVMAPYPVSNLKVVISAIRIDATGAGKITWSDTLHGNARSKDSNVTVPEALRVPNSTLIWSEVQYTYTPVVGYVVTGPLVLKDQIYMRPRLSDSIARPTT